MMNPGQSAPKVLVIDDVPEVAEVVAICIELRWPGAIVLAAGNGLDGLDLLAKQSPDLVILDVGLPGMDGFQVLREIRNRSPVPVIMLTVRDAETDIARALEMGADDYISKPFGHLEMLARVNAVLRRTQVPAPGEMPQAFVSVELKVDFGARDVWVRGQRVRLTPIEFSLLAQLARHAGKVVSHRDLLTNVWGEEYTDALNYLKVHVQRLRRKLGDDPQDPRLIITEWKVGYKLATPSDEALPEPPTSGASAN